MKYKRYFYKEEADARLPEGEKGISAICQPPVSGEQRAVLEFPLDGNDVLWTMHLLPSDTSQDSEGQMRQIFEQYTSLLAAEGMTVAGNCIRTWIFVRDIDNNYAGVVKGRREFFEEIGLTEYTHYIASTGINGTTADPDVLVSMDAVAVRALDHSKVRYLKALDHLNPTHEYGVTFERGTQLELKGEKIVLISGTASIDSKGEVMYVGDVSRQTERVLENISALLADGGTVIDKVEAVIVYLRNGSDADAVKKVLKKKAPGMKYTMVVAPVCRPTWLVEIECMARF